MTENDAHFLICRHALSKHILGEWLLSPCLCPVSSSCCQKAEFRDRSLIRGGGGCYKKRERGGECSFTHTKGGRGEERNVLAVLKWGQKQFWGSFNTGALSFSQTEGGCKMFPAFKEWGGGGGGVRIPFDPVLRQGGAQKVSEPQLSHFVAPLRPRN